MQRLINILTCLDSLIFSIITLGKAYPNESISSAAYRGELDGKLMGMWFRPLIDGLFFFDDNHCYESYLNVKEGRLLPESYRENIPK